MSWKFNGNIVTEENTPEGAVGFVYKMIHIPTGRFYIGKKSLNQVRRLKPLKGKTRKRVVRSASDWEKYYSSNEWIKSEVKAGNAEYFEREIIQFLLNFTRSQRIAITIQLKQVVCFRETMREWQSKSLTATTDRDQKLAATSSCPV